MAADEGSDILSLGGNIELAGFKEIDRSQMIVVKKIVGQYARQMSEQLQHFEKLNVALETEENTFLITATLKHGGKEVTENASNTNLFFALDACLDRITGQRS